MKSIRMLIFYMVILCLCLYSIAFAANDIYKRGDLIENFTVTTYDGQTVTLSEVLKEKDMVLINIWATWCGPCRSEFPYMEEAYKQFRDKIEIIALSSEPADTNDVLSSFAAEMGLTFKVAQDTPNFSAKFGVSGIPTSIVVDRNGVICYIASGAMTSTDQFTRLFNAFVGDDYSEAVLLDALPPIRPDVMPSQESDLTEALGVTTVNNPTDVYTWPMVVAEKDGRQVVAASNTGKNESKASISASVSAKADDAIVVSFKLSAEILADTFAISVNDKKVKSFTGEHDWMTYAIPVSEDGEYQIELAFAKDVSNHGGEDCVWVDSITVLSGESAQAALATNPAYPIGDTNSIQASNPEAREITITDPTGLMVAYFGADCRYFITNTDIAQFKATITSDIDPEVAFLYSNYDRAITPLTQAVTADGYEVESAVDSRSSTGYEYTNMVLYPDMNSYPVATVMFFRDEANVNSFVSNNLKDRTGTAVGSWQYVEEPAADSSLFNRPVDDGMSDYVLKCIDQNGNPVAGVMIQVCDTSTCQVFVTDSNGICTFTNVSYAWEVHILKAPEGYTADFNAVVLAPVEGGELVLTLTKN